MMQMEEVHRNSRLSLPTINSSPHLLPLLPLLFSSPPSPTLLFPLWQSPKTPLQKSMSTLGKQLSFYSLCIIGQCAPPLLQLPSSLTVTPSLPPSSWHYAPGLAAGKRTSQHVHNWSQVLHTPPQPTSLVTILVSPGAVLQWQLFQRVCPSW